jgi:hypothetical protein
MLHHIAIAAATVALYCPTGTGWVEEYPATAYQATISVPASLPAGADDEYAWVMADGYGSQLNQVGWAWWPFKGPVVFAYTVQGNQTISQGEWAIGPALAPGSSVRVQITRSGNTFVDEYDVGQGWVPFDISHEQFGSWATYMESYGTPMTACFTGRAWEGAGVWHTLPGGCV